LWPAFGGKVSRSLRDATGWYPQPDAKVMHDFVVFADSDLIVVNKPAGLPSVPGRPPELKDSAISRLQAIYSDALVVHRLDMATSGLLLFARGPTMQRALSQLFEQRQIKKRYEAVVHGHLKSPAGTIELPLIADWPNRPRQKVDWAHGKPATTHWRLLPNQHSESYSRLELSPITGRSHQLRLHLCAVGHPIVGDPLYGSDHPSGLSSRLLLHASHLEFIHPGRQEHVEFCAAVPF
jgi:tRNA pseudouridine32 synthase/23S rRNA pseudouridine746 synthase